MRDNGNGPCEVIELLSDDDETPVNSPSQSASNSEVIVLDATDSQLPTKPKEALFHDDFHMSICNKPSEVRVFDVKPCPSSRKQPRTARKSISSFTPRFNELIDVPSSDEDNNESHQPNNALERFLNQVFVALKPNISAVKEIETKLNTAYNQLSISKTEVLYSYILQLTMNLSLDSKKVYDYVEELLERLKSLNQEKERNKRKISHSSGDEEDSSTSNHSSTKKKLKLSDEDKSSCQDEKMKIIPNKGKKVPIVHELEDEDCFVKNSKKLNSANNSKKKENVSKASNSQTNAHIKKLKDALDVCGKEIQRLELAEVDTNDDESSYVLMCKYKRRFMNIYNKIIELEGELPKWKSQVVSLQTLGSHQIKKFKDTISRHPEINSRIANFINKGIKKSLNSTYFPDFQDIMQIYVEVNKSSNLGMHKEEIYHEASDAFQLIGRKLQSRRVNDVHASMESYLKEDEPEPVLSDEVKKRLKENQVIAEQSLDKVIQDFTFRQARGSCDPPIRPSEVDETGDEDDESISSLEDDSDDESQNCSSSDGDLSSSESSEDSNNDEL